ncbi:hypothetical protein [Jannaschia sp. CCS1]|uniref:hypothetical protein n=1 Tax=Jannaschia sp. (strain CCS1) TaxID=290400 RepID=UPI0002D691A5|nr:hypothetical protein [Jannaschia sp. CCS1]
MTRLAVVILLGLTGVVRADGLIALDDAGITAALTERTVTYDNGATQHFFASGRTRYTHAEPTWGSWRVENDQYCSLWPPAPTWDCYAVQADGAGRITFVDQWGNATSGARVP